MHLLLHPFTRERKKTQKTKAQKTKTQKKTQKKNENAYFQERRRILSRTKTQNENENEDPNSRRTMSTQQWRVLSVHLCTCHFALHTSCRLDPAIYFQISPFIYCIDAVPLKCLQLGLRNACLNIFTFKQRRASHDIILKKCVFVLEEPHTS